jgi:hypothetical protein
MNQAGPSGINRQLSTFNFNGAQQRHPQPPQQGLTGMGGMGRSMRPPGESGLSFDVILSRLQGELQKSRETGAELNTLTGVMNEMLGGSRPVCIGHIFPLDYCVHDADPFSPQICPQFTSTYGYARQNLASSSLGLEG